MRFLSQIQKLKRMNIIVLLCFSVALSVHANDLAVLPETIYGVSPDNMMKHYLLQSVDQSWENWQTNYEKIKTSEQIAERQKFLREKFIEVIGDFPQRTLLNPQITGVVQRDGYRVEKVLFESQPKHYVTGLLFVPQSQRWEAPYPAVLVPCGHYLAAKAHDEYQAMGALLALNGMVGLVYDPIGQGERMQWLDKTGKPKAWGTQCHDMIGVGSILLGRNTATFEIWDGMCGIDYLQSRPDVDPNRIGCTGNSGGGTQTSYLMALDDRIIAASPSCYHHIKSTHIRAGRGDAENHIFSQLKLGWEPADYIMMRAPVPILMCSATGDFLPIEDVWTIFRYANRLYTRMGFAERLAILENDAGHNYNKSQREGIVRWMARWLQGRDEHITEPDIKLLEEKEAWCTPDGQTLKIDGARSAYDLNQDYEQLLARRRKKLWSSKNTAELLDQVRQIAGIRNLSDLPEPCIEKAGRIGRDNYHIDKLIIKPEQGIYLPALMFIPDNVVIRKVVLYLHEKGKASVANPVGPIESLVNCGSAVLAVDLRGVGETRPKRENERVEADYVDCSTAYLLGRCYVGMRAEDILWCARYAAGLNLTKKTDGVDLIAVGNVAVPALHAAALEPQLFDSVTLKETCFSWSEVIARRLISNQYINCIHGALKIYDLPDLAATLGDRVTIDGPIDTMEK